MKSRKCDLKVIDLYEKRIEFTYDGMEGFRTTLGAIASLIVLLCTVSMLGVKIDLLLNRGDTTSKTNFLIRPLSNEGEPFEVLNDKGFLFAFSIKESPS
jgi:hypothetical protein